MTLTQTATMEAIVQQDFGDANQLKLKRINVPVPSAGKIQIQIHYSAVNPVDWKIREGYLQQALPHRFPIIPGWDAAGVISAIGDNVTKFKIGDPVFAYCRKPVIQWGTYAEYVCVDANHIALKPENLSFAEAAAFPLAGLTAWQALFDLAHLKKDESVLIHAGAGGVGSLAIQFAKNKGAHALATSSKEKHAYLKSLGADVVIDYREPNFLEKIRESHPNGVDVILDSIGGEVYRKSFDYLKKGGRIVSLLEQPDEKLAKSSQTQAYYLFVTPNGQQLEEIAQLIKNNKVKPITILEMSLQEAAKAQEISQNSHTQGKIVLKIK